MLATSRVKAMSRERLKLLVLLGAPTLGLALAATTVAVIVPVLLRPLTASSALIGAVIAGEGLLALLLAPVLGSLSDRTKSRWGPRLPYVLLAAPLCTLMLLALPLAHSFAAIAATTLVFYAGYNTYYPTYRALFPALLESHELGRSQGVQTLFREIGLGLALVVAPLLLAWSRPLPFIFAALVIASISTLFIGRIRRAASAEKQHPDAPVLGIVASFWALLKSHANVRRVLLANALWETAISGLKTFVVLYLVAGAGHSAALASGAMAIVAIVAIVAAPLAGHLADRFGTIRVMRLAFIVFGLGLLVPAFTRSLFVLLPALPLIGFSGAVAMTLPYALLAQYLPRQSYGAGSGLYDFSRGLGNLSGPLITGVAVDLTRMYVPGADGYGALWVVAGTSVLLSIPLLPKQSLARAPSGLSGPATEPSTRHLPSSERSSP